MLHRKQIPMCRIREDTWLMIQHLAIPEEHDYFVFMHWHDENKNISTFKGSLLNYGSQRVSLNEVLNIFAKKLENL